MVLLLVAALVFGVMLVLPIGGADMPVDLVPERVHRPAAASTGFVLDNAALIIGGTLVGASGTLPLLMGRAMNRSLANVLFSASARHPREAQPSGSGRATSSARSRPTMPR